MSTAKNGDTVQVHYKGILEDGTVFDSSEGRDPISFTLGDGQVIPGFDKAIDGMEAGETKTVTIPATDAYGDRREELMLTVSRDVVPKEMELEVGMPLQLEQPGGGQFQVVVAEVGDEEVILDGNHPLAGKDLTFELSLDGIGEEDTTGGD